MLINGLTVLTSEQRVLDLRLLLIVNPKSFSLLIYLVNLLSMVTSLHVRCYSLRVKIYIYQGKVLSADSFTY